MSGQSVAKIDVQQAEVVRQFQYERPRRACAFDPSARYLVSGGDENVVRRWDLNTDSHTALEGHESWVLSFAMPASGPGLITGGYDGRLAWWELTAEQPAPLEMIDAHQGWIRSMAIDPKEELLATCGNDRLVKIWSLETRRQIQELQGHESHVYSVAFHPDAQSLVSADHLGVIRQWDTATWQELRQLDASPLYTWNKGYRAAAGGVRGLNFSHDGRWLAGCGLTDATDTFGQVVHPAVVLFDWENGERIRTQRSAGPEKGVAWGVVFHPSEGFHTAVCGGRDGRHLYFWTKEDDKPFHTLSLPSAGRDLSLTVDGTRLAVAHFDGAVRLIDL